MEPDFVFEVSWEVCNKVGGINTVLKTKAKEMVTHFKSKYFMIGPYFPEKSSAEFIQLPTPGFLREIFEELTKLGINVRFGKWLVKGEPQTILIDFSQFSVNKNKIKAKYWNLYRIDSLNTDYFDYDMPIIWSTAVGVFLEIFEKHNEDKKIIVHCHEWLSSGVILHLKSVNSSIATVFTTHATMLGRTISGHGYDLFETLNTIDPDKECYKYNIQAKHQTEKVTAHLCDVFTTVSEITSIEVEKILGKKPHVITPNGICVSNYPSFEEISIKHRRFRNKIRHFLTYYFFPYYDFDIEQSLNFFIASRYEFHVKGIDLFIDALGMLNKRMMNENHRKTIIAFIFVPSNVRGIKEEVIVNRENFNDLYEYINHESDLVINRLIRALISRREINEQVLFSKESLLEIEKLVLKIKKQGKPGIITHYLENEENDLIIKRIKENGLDNSKASKVKVIFYPIYLNGADGLLNLNYEEAIIGSHLGVFPSVYEPWGYTPLECAINGVPSVTTDLSGFGRFLISKHAENKGIFVLNFMNKSYEERVKQLCEVMYKFASYHRPERVELKIKAKETAAMASWANLIENYLKAYQMALIKRYT